MPIIAPDKSAVSLIDWQHNDLYRFFALVFATPTRECFDLLSQPGLPEALRNLWKQLGCEGKFSGFEWFGSYEQYESTYIALFDVGIPEPPCLYSSQPMTRLIRRRRLRWRIPTSTRFLGSSRIPAAPFPTTLSPSWSSSPLSATPANIHPKRALPFRWHGLRLNFWNATY